MIFRLSTDGPKYLPIPLQEWDIEYYGDSIDLFDAIREVIRRLPNDVGRFAVSRCVFVSIGLGAFGMVLPARIGTHAEEKRTRNMWLIILDERMPKDEVHGAVAHEIAHAWLKHDPLDPDIPDSCEVDAATLAKKWGFSGKGTDPDTCDRVDQMIREINARR